MSRCREAAFDLKKESFEVKVGLAAMLKGGVIVDVTTPEEARIAEEGGAIAVMAAKKIHPSAPQPANNSRMSDPELITKIQEEISIPVMGKCRIGHFVEAEILEALFVDFIDESELLTPADAENYINKHTFRIPFVCGCKDLGDALRRIGEGASLVRTKRESKGGNIATAVGQIRSIVGEVRRIATMDDTELMTIAKKMGAPYRLIQEVAEKGKLPVPYFASGGITTPADAAMMIQLGAESLFVGSEIFDADDPLQSIRAVVAAVSHYNDPEMLAKISRGLLDILPERELCQLSGGELRSERNW